MKRTIALICLLIATACLVLLGCAGSNAQDSSAETDTQQQKVVIGCDYYPPFYLRDEKGNSCGVDADIAAEAFKRIGYGVEFEQIPWEKKDELLTAGKIDCIMSCFTMTGREKDYLWAGPYMRSRQVVAVEENSNIQHLSDLKGKSIGIQATTKPEHIFLDKTNPSLPETGKLISFSDRSYLYPAVMNGLVDAIAAHEPSVLQYEEDYGIELRILDEPLQEVGLGVAFAKKDSRGIAQALDKSLGEMRDDGTMRAIIADYFENPDELLDLDGVANE